MLGGYRSGKTDVHCKVMCKLSLINVGGVGLEIAPTYPMLRDVLITKWRDFLTENDVDFDKIYHKSEKVLRLPWGTDILFRSADSSFVGITASFAGADEDIGFDQFKQMMVRVSDPKAKQLAAILTTTPDCDWLDECLAMFPGCKVWNLSVLDNYLLDPAVIESYRRMYSEEEAECYMHGKLVRLSGAVFHSFTQENISDRDFEKGTPYFCAVDFGARHPVVLFFQELDGCLYQIDEWCPQAGHHLIDTGIEQQLSKYGRPTFVYCDPAGDAVNDQTYLSDIRYLIAKGYDCQYTFNPMLRAIPLGIQLLNGLFRDAGGKRKLFINRRCETTIRDLRAARYPTEGRAGIKDLPVKDGRVDHTRDALRYMVVGRYGKDWLRNRRLLKGE